MSIQNVNELYRQPLSSLDKEQQRFLFNSVLATAVCRINKEFENLEHKVEFVVRVSKPLSSGVHFLSLRGTNGKIKPISIINPKSHNGLSCKKIKCLVGEIRSKIIFHHLFEFTSIIDKCCFISASGSKFFSRHLQSHTVALDEDNALLIDGRKIKTLDDTGATQTIMAFNINSYTRLIFVNSKDDKDLIHLYDEDDLSRDKKGMVIKVNAIGQHLLEYVNLTPETKDYLASFLFK